MHITEFTTDAEFASIYPFIQQLNPGISHAEFETLLAAMRKEGFRCVGAFEGHQCLGISGFWVGHKFYSRKFLHIDAFCVDGTERSRGVGKQLLDWMESLAKNEKCEMVVLDTYTSNTASHKFYCREDYTIAGYHFLKKL